MLCHIYDKDQLFLYIQSDDYTGDDIFSTEYNFGISFLLFAWIHINDVNKITAHRVI